MPTIDTVRSHWQGSVNKSPKCKKLKAELEARGHTDVNVWWENLGQAFEMGGPSGGYLAVTEQRTDVEPLGYSFEEALDHIKTVPWLQLAEAVRG